ncbi:hypothetical protein B0H10DRAFT_1968503 [Mycena sp. CBHHK59/15]|nr:hypothetical protein B0H10DRAFT_1968503 [Mycena sp. CBHHK59/15]
MSETCITLCNAEEPFSGPALPADDACNPDPWTSLTFIATKVSSWTGPCSFCDMTISVSSEGDIFKEGKPVIPIIESAAVSHPLLLRIYPAMTSDPFLPTQYMKRPTRFPSRQCELAAKAAYHSLDDVVYTQRLNSSTRTPSQCLQTSMPFAPLTGGSLHQEMLGQPEFYPSCLILNNEAHAEFVWWAFEGHSAGKQRMLGSRSFPPSGSRAMSHGSHIVSEPFLVPDLREAFNISPPDLAAILTCPACSKFAQQDLERYGHQLALLVDNLNIHGCGSDCITSFITPLITHKRAVKASRQGGHCAQGLNNNAANPSKLSLRG